MSFKQIKQVFEEGKFSESLNLSQKILQREPQNKAALYFLAASFQGIGNLSEAQNVLNNLYSLIYRPEQGKQSPDDALYFQALHLQKKIAISMQISSNGNKQIFQQGIQTQIDNQFQILDFLDKKKNYQKMLEEVETYCLLCIQNNQQFLIEDTYIWLFQHHALSPDIQLKYGCLIFFIDDFKPKTILEQHFFRLAALFQEIKAQKLKLTKEDTDNLVSLAKKLLDFLDRQSWKKDIYTALQAVAQNPNAIVDYKRYIDGLIVASEVYYEFKPMEIVSSETQMNNFARFLAAKSISLQLHSQEWYNFISNLQIFSRNEFFANTFGDFDSNPVQLLVHAILDFSEVLKTGVIPSNPKDYLFLSNILKGRKLDAVKELDFLSEQYAKMTPIVNVYYAMCLNLMPLDIQMKFDWQKVYQKLEQADFLNRKIIFYKLLSRKQPSDFTIISLCLKINATQHLPETERTEQTAKIEQQFEKVSAFASPKFIPLYSSQICQIRWTNLIDQGKWKDAIDELEKVAEFDETKKSWALVNKAWIQFSFLAQLAQSPNERKQVLQQICNDLTTLCNDQTNEIAAKALTYKAYIIYKEGQNLELHGEDAQSQAPLNLWVQALKRDQTKPEIFYSLATWYYFDEVDIQKAKKCAEKALLLKPDFEQAFLLLHQIIGNKDSDALEQIQKVQSVNKNIASTYYLKGVILSNQGDYIQAIDNLQNATKFYTIDHLKANDRSMLKPAYLQLTELFEKHNNKIFSLFTQQLGIFGIHPNLCVSAWILLTDCFSKIEKPQVALKCFQKAMEEITLVIQKINSSQISLEKFKENPKQQDEEVRKYARLILSYLEEAKSFTQVSYDKQQNDTIQIALNQILNLLQLDQPPLILVETIDCLLIGARIVSSDQLSIKIALIAIKILSCVESNSINAWNVLEVALNQIMYRQAQIMVKNQTSVYSKVQFTSEDQKQITCATQITSSAEHCTMFENSLNIQKSIQVVLLTISQKIDDSKQKEILLRHIYKRSLVLRKKFVPANTKDIGPVAREILIDAAKIAYECCRNKIEIEGVNFESEQIKLIRKSIMLEPLRAELWVLLYLFLADDSAVKAQAIFKAYELEPESPFVQQYLIRHYMKSTKSYTKAFKVIVKSYQQSINQLTEQNPIVIATLALLNAKSCFLDKSLLAQEKRSHLQEALSLIQQINREDLISMFSELKFFLLQEKGDYLESIKFLTYATSDPKQAHGMLRLLLLQAFMGTQAINFEYVKDQYQKFAAAEDLNEIQAHLRSKLQYIFEIQNVPKEALRVETESTIQEFAINQESAKLLASKLTLLQEVCLQLNILPGINLLDLKTDILELLDNMEIQQQRTILVQSLRFLQMRDGKILEQTAVREEGVNNEQQQQIESQLINYSRFLHQVSKYSLPQLPSLSLAQNKALLRLFLEMKPNLEESHTLKMHNSQRIDSKDHKLKGLQTVITKLKQDMIYAQKELMKNPTCFYANITWIWSLFHRGKGKDAIKAFALLQHKLKVGIVNSDQTNCIEYKRIVSFINLFSGQEIKMFPEADRLDLIAIICRQINTFKENKEVTDDLVNSLVDSVATGMIKSLVCIDINAWPQLLNDFFKFLKIFVFDQRQFLIFNKLTARMLQITVSLLSPQALTQEIKNQSSQDKYMLVLINEIWIFKTLHNGSSLTELKKFAGCDNECNQAEKVLNLGLFKRNPLPAQLLKARAYLLVKNFQQSASILELTTDQAILERDFIVALANYSQQAYKQFYLCAMGLVAGCKSFLDSVQVYDSIDTKRQAHFNLAYAYYMKIFAEATFHAARVRNLTLQEDFVGESDANMYDQAFFFKKVNQSIAKCQKELIKAGDTEGLLARAVKEISDEINQNKE